MKLLAVKIKYYFNIWRLHLHANLMRRMAYPSNFYLMAVGVTLQMIFSIIFVKIIFNFIDNLSGWTYYEALLVVASYMIIEGLMWGSCAFLNGISRNINQGMFDSILVKPINKLYLASICQSDPEDWMRVITALIIFFISFSHLNLTVFGMITGLVLYIFLIINSFFILYSLTLVIRSLSFWTIESEGMWRILESLTRNSQYPTDIFFHKLVRIFFTAVIPLAFMASVPAKILIHGPNLFLIISSTVLTISFFYISRKFFYYALRHYSSASS
jgi:ABC-2 type transport system permease protein